MSRPSDDNGSGEKAQGASVGGASAGTSGSDCPATAYFGTQMTPRTAEQWLAFIGECLALSRQRQICACHNLHSLYLRHTVPDMATFYARSHDCYIDGMPIRLLCRLFGARWQNTPRFSLMDHFPQLLEHARRHQWRLFYLGSSPEVVASAQARIEHQYAGLDIRLHHGYFNDEAQIAAMINAQQPHLLMIGMGMPRQERWLLRNIDQLDFACVTQTGATLDYFTGAQARPPLWMSKAGLGWLYRLAHDPRRLWRRYLVEPWGLLRPTVTHWRRFAAQRNASDHRH
ncbi:MAG: WecB/TagA/CpsF family glycosyltransferase [Gammaproteobacteria bacterium]|nr:WecB/TagA/CpsF family glycosyltransferase [Gammaproteobacteria bacterium]